MLNSLKALMEALKEDQKDQYTYETGDWIYSIELSRRGSKQEMIATVHVQWPRMSRLLENVGAFYTVETYEHDKDTLFVYAKNKYEPLQFQAILNREDLEAALHLSEHELPTTLSDMFALAREYEVI